LLTITTDPADFAPGVVSIYNAFGKLYKGIVFASNLIQTPGYRFENPAIAPGLLLTGIVFFYNVLIKQLISLAQQNGRVNEIFFPEIFLFI